MLRNLILILLVSLAVFGTAAAETLPVIVPQPKSMSVTGAAVALEPGRVAIVVGAKASEPERYAAERLKKFVNKRFGQDWPIVDDRADLKPYNALMVLGQQSSNKLVGPACRDFKINTSEKFPVQDGYALGVGRIGGRTVAVVAGTNPRSVIYGQDTLFQLMAGKGGTLILNMATIRDWPSLPHRGRVCTGAQQFQSEEVLDAAALGRLNFIDVRYGTYATPPGYKIDHDSIKWIVREAHKRGMLVYGTVSLAVQKPEYDKCIATFREFIDLGVDGLWPYLGDPGGEGRSGTPLELLARVIELGKKHDMTGDLIHYTPGKMGYKTIATNDNFSAAKVPGMADALWFFAVKPTPESFADAAKLGLNKKYVWWNHWPHPRGGFTSCGNPSMRADGKSNIYADLTPFQDAYQSPTVAELAKVPQYSCGAIPWGGTIWLQETVLGPFGWYAWSPETDDAGLTRRRVYDYLYGPDMVETALEFNKMLAELKSKVILCGDEHEAKDYVWPPLLRDPAFRTQCREIVDKMYAPMEKLAKGAAKGSLLDAATLEKFFFEPMRAELAAAKIVIEVPRLEYWWEASQSRIRAALREGNCAQAFAWQDAARQRVLDDSKNAQEMLAGVVNAGDAGSKRLEDFDRLAGDAVYTSTPIVLDGELDEPAWLSAPKLGPFRICNDAETTETPSHAQVVYSDDALYIGLTYGEPNMDMIIAARTAHDSDVWEDDSFELFINPDAYGMPYYHFVANTNGVTADSGYKMGEDADFSWNGGWQVKIAKKPDRWVAEIKIPYATVSATKPAKDNVWLCNFARHDRSDEEKIRRGENFERISSWGFRPRGQLHDTLKFRPIWFK